ncbi:hypothetical protein P0R31_15890 [Bradyrhizobium yuanmingense]|nr:hypothetical protein [Bradyrhizobium yuanmingense]
MDRTADQGLGGLLQVAEALIVLQAGTQFPAEVPQAPSTESQYDDAELAARIRQGIGSSGRMIAVEFAAHEAVFLKYLQAIGEHIGSHAGQAFLKILKAHGAGKQVPDDEQRPPRADDVERSGYRTSYVEALSCHPIEVPESLSCPNIVNIPGIETAPLCREHDLRGLASRTTRFARAVAAPLAGQAPATATASIDRFFLLWVVDSSRVLL